MVSLITPSHARIQKGLCQRASVGEQVCRTSAGCTRDFELLWVTGSQAVENYTPLVPLRVFFAVGQNQDSARVFLTLASTDSIVFLRPSIKTDDIS